MEDIPRISDAQWSEIKNTLPAGADENYVRNRLEQIVKTEIVLAEMGAKQLAIEWEEVARHYGALRESIEAAPPELPEPEPSEQRAAFLQELKRRGDAAETQAALYRQIGEVRRSGFRRHCQLLWVWEAIGGKLGISNPPRKLSDKPGWPDPTGPVIDYFQAAAKAVFGQTPGPKQIRDIVRDFCRLHLAARTSAEVNFLIDDSRVFVIDKDGNVVG